MATNANPLYPRGTSYTVVIEEERKLREAAEGEVDRRLCEIEERLFIVESYDYFHNNYPELVKAYKKFRQEEAKMKTFETIKNSK